MADRKTEAGAAELARGRGVQLGELLEQHRNFLGRHTHPGVRHADMQPLGAGVPHAFDADVDRAFVGELQRVGDQVGDDLAKARGIAEANATGVIGNLDVQEQLLFLRHSHKAVARAVDHALQLELYRVQLQLAGLDLRYVEDVVQNFEQCLAGFADHVQPLALLTAEIAERHDLRHREHAVQRGSDLVAHVGQELRLLHIGRLGGVASMGKLVHGDAKLAVVGLQSLQQAVEAIGQPSELIVGDRLDPAREVAVQRHIAHRLAETVDRLRYAPGQRPPKKQREPGGGEEQRSCDRQIPRQELAADR